MKELVPLLIFVVLSIICSILAHKFIKSYLAAVIVSTVTVTLLFQGLGFLIMGYIDPFFIFAMIFSGVYAALISSFVGIPFAYMRRKK